MNNNEKQIVVKIEEIIEIILDNQDYLVIDSKIMNKLSSYFNKYEDIFDEMFIRNYISFIEIFNLFFDFLMNKLVMYENSLMDEEDLQNNYFFTFSFNEFEEKEVLLPFKEMLFMLEEMFPGNRLLQGIVLFIHLNNLLKRRMFCNNKIKFVSNNLIIEIDYGYRVDYYKEEYITIFRHELEEGIRNSVFIDNSEIVSYIKGEIKELNSRLC